MLAPLLSGDSFDVLQAQPGGGVVARRCLFRLDGGLQLLHWWDDTEAEDFRGGSINLRSCVRVGMCQERDLVNRDQALFLR